MQVQETALELFQHSFAEEAEPNGIQAIMEKRLDDYEQGHSKNNLIDITPKTVLQAVRTDLEINHAIEDNMTIVFVPSASGTPCADAFVGFGIARRQTFRWEPARSLRVLAITLQVRRQRLP